ncbi:MAG: hydroxyphenylacetyl-CoA thioesterase PaaI [Actinomycetales bacterium]
MTTPERIPSERIPPERLATLAAEAMWDGDAASKALGMSLDAVTPGGAQLRMTVRPDMLNGVGTCHGGIVFSLADSAFAFACNSGNEVTVAAGCDISFLLPARLGDVLVATAVQRHRSGRNGITDVTVRREADGQVVAEFRGRSRTLGGHLIDPASLEDDNR